MTKHVWLVVDEQGCPATNNFYMLHVDAVNSARELADIYDGQFLPVRATYEWPKGGKR